MSLLNADHRAAEELATRLVATPQVRAQRAITLERFRQDPAAATPDGEATLENAIDELAFATAMSVAADDPTHPQMLWTFIPPRQEGDTRISGSRWGGDNPDNVYRSVILDGSSRYEMTVQVVEPGPIDYGFQLYDSVLGENTKQEDLLDNPIAGLLNADLVPGPDGVVTITIDSEPAGARVNHIRSNPDTRIMLIRNTFSDWSRENPLEIDIRRLSGPVAGPPERDLDHLARRTVELLADATEGDLALKAVLAGPGPNALCPPVTRGGGWGYVAFGRFALGKNQVLVATLDPLGGTYLGVDVLDPWMLSREHVTANGSLNNSQALAGTDGAFTYVLGPDDPAVWNWADTGGLHEGILVLRWQGLPETVTDEQAKAAVRTFTVVDRGDLSKVLPDDAVTVDAAGRKQQLADRAASYARRLG